MFKYLILFNIIKVLSHYCSRDIVNHRHSVHTAVGGVGSSLQNVLFIYISYSNYYILVFGHHKFNCIVYQYVIVNYT